MRRTSSRTSMAIPRPGPKGKITDAELVALAVAQAAMGVPVRSPVPRACREGACPAGFRICPDQSQYNRRLRRLAPWIAAVQLRVAELVAAGELRIADGTLIGVANYPGCVCRSEFAGRPPTATAPSKSQFLWGMRLVLVTDRNGLPVGYTLVAANEKEYEPVRELDDRPPRLHPDRRQGPVGASNTPRRSLCRTSRSSHPTAHAPPRTSPARSDWPACGS